MRDKDGEKMFNLYVESQNERLLREGDAIDNLDIDKVKSYLDQQDQQDPMFTQYVLPNIEAYLQGKQSSVDIEGHMATRLPDQEELMNYLDTIKHGRVGNLARKGASAITKGVRNLGRTFNRYKPEFRNPVQFPGRR